MSGHLAYEVEVRVEMAAPESPYASPGLRGETWTRDSVENPSDGSTRQGVFLAVYVDKADDVRSDLTFVFAFDL